MQNKKRNLELVNFGSIPLVLIAYFFSLSHNNVGSGGLICLIFDPSCNCYPNSSPRPDEKGVG